MSQSVSTKEVKTFIASQPEPASQPIAVAENATIRRTKYSTIQQLNHTLKAVQEMHRTIALLNIEPHFLEDVDKPNNKERVIKMNQEAQSKLIHYTKEYMAAKSDKGQSDAAAPAA